MSAKIKDRVDLKKPLKDSGSLVKIRTVDIIAVIIITFFAFAIRFFNLSLPAQYYFDEIYYVPAAQAYKQMKKDPNWVHPPLGKILIAQGSVFSDKTFLKWRIAGVVLGCLMVPLVYFLALYMFKSTLASSMAAFFLSIDFLHFAQCRIAILDIFLAFFMLVSAYFLWLSIYKKELELKYFCLSAVFSGFACACKWSGFFSVIFTFIFVLLYNRKNFFRNFLIYTVLLLFAYFITYIPYFICGGTIKGLYNIFLDTMRFQYKGGWNHNYMSPIWKWPLLLRPIWYYYKNIGKDSCAGIIAMGNPLFWWPFLVFFAATAYRAIFFRAKEDCFLVLGYICSFIFWIFSNRGGFFYYMAPAVVWMALIVAGSLYRVKFDNIGKVFTYGYISVVFLVFCLYYPLMTAIPVSLKYFKTLFFLRFWI